jgi:hypothetical protein
MMRMRMTTHILVFHLRFHGQQEIAPRRMRLMREPVAKKGRERLNPNPFVSKFKSTPSLLLYHHPNPRKCSTSSSNLHRGFRHMRCNIIVSSL